MQVAAKRAQSALVRPGSRFATMTPQMTSTRVPTSIGLRAEQNNTSKLDVPDIARVHSAPSSMNTICVCFMFFYDLFIEL